MGGRKLVFLRGLYCLVGRKFGFIFCGKSRGFKFVEFRSGGVWRRVCRVVEKSAG